MTQPGIEPGLLGHWQPQTARPMETHNWGDKGVYKLFVLKIVT